MWPAIILLANQNYCTDIDVIHHDKVIDIKTKVLMIIHHFFIVVAIAGFFFNDRVSVGLHLLLVLIELGLWKMYNGCVMAHLQREWIDYGPEELTKIHGTDEHRDFEFYSITLLAILVDVLKFLRP
jgi:hypothetical protein